MNYCIHLRKRKNKPYCKLLNKEITLSQCQECASKKYKTKNNQNSVYKIRNAQKNKKNVQNSKIDAKFAQKLQKMKLKSKKQAKKEKERYSVFTTDDKCMICNSKHYLTWNEIFRGRNRSNSMKYGFCLRMCLTCHELYQEDVFFNDTWHKKAQIYFEEHYGTRNDFIIIFRRNYLE